MLQVLSLLPVYLLELCYGMNSGYTAILTPQVDIYNIYNVYIHFLQYLQYLKYNIYNIYIPQLYGHCSELAVDLDQLSWIGELSSLCTVHWRSELTA